PSLEFEVGRHKPPLGVLPPGYAFRLRTQVNGRKHAGKIPGSKRIYNPDGSPGAKWADPEHRDW
ncbi:hypothetical protein, partial [Klebsiella pneumoniae]|uniref:hypothetical protein n=1 Tax=Klebsiella pneumoniae TaxID=573 RepID=UPI0030138FFF